MTLYKARLSISLSTMMNKYQQPSVEKLFIYIHRRSYCIPLTDRIEQSVPFSKKELFHLRDDTGALRREWW